MVTEFLPAYDVKRERNKRSKSKNFKKLRLAGLCGRWSCLRSFWLKVCESILSKFVARITISCLILKTRNFKSLKHKKYEGNQKSPQKTNMTYIKSKEKFPRPAWKS